jgi:SOS response regulatory protein OraA/RecX
LAVSSAGFVFPHRKLGRIDETLQTLTKDVKAVRLFLERQDRARLAAALKTLNGIAAVQEEQTRRALLVNARQTLGELYENYAEQLKNVSRLDEVFAIEEYFTVTALGLAMCSAELDLRKQALHELQDAHRLWDGSVKRIAQEMVFRKEPHRFMESRYANIVRTDELVDWMDYVFEANKQVEWIDDLRRASSWLRTRSSEATKEEHAEVELMRKLASRHRVYEGYVSGYEMLQQSDMRPSMLQSVFDAVPEDQRVNDCLVFVRTPPLASA